jgi:hypothetical protein
MSTHLRDHGPLSQPEKRLRKLLRVANDKRSNRYEAALAMFAAERLAHKLCIILL